MSQVQTNAITIRSIYSIIKEALRGEQQDYTSGSMRKAIILLAIPMILELALESVFAIVDTFVVGKLGADAIQTVGLTEATITIVYSIAIGLSTGATAMVARRIGEKNPDEAAHAGAQSLLISIVLTIVISILGFVFAPNILRLMGANNTVASEGAVFTRIMMGGSIVIMLLFLINGIFRGAGDAAMAMRSLWIASAMNIILCPLLVHGIGGWEGLGLKGAAIATVIGRGTGVIYQCYHLFRGNSIIHIKMRHLKFDWPLIKAITTVSWPATFQFLIGSASWIFLTRLIAETGGAESSAGYQVAIRNIMFFLLPAWGLSNAAATLVGQNLGAKQPERAEQSAWLAAKYNAIFMAIVTVIFLFLAFPIVSLYSSDPKVREVGTLSLQIICAGYVFYGVGMVMIQALNGAGDTKTPTWVNFVCFWLIQIPLAYVLAKGFDLGPKGAFIAIPVAETVIAVWAYFIFRKGKWKRVVI